MREKKQRIDTSGPVSPLTSNPFADLLGGTLHSPEPNRAPAPSPEAAPTVKTSPPFRIARTKKGGYPIFLEKRAAGKTVTVLRNVSGDAEALLALLKKRCAAGGKAFDDSVEIQGDHCARVEAFLREKAL